MPQAKLLSYLEDADQHVGQDCSVVRQGDGSLLVSTTDFFFPLVDNPYVQGQIAAANVLSDLYAMGVVRCSTMLMLLGVCTAMSEEERDVVTRLMMRGFRAVAAEAETAVTGGQTVKNPWPLIGGVAMSVCASEADVLRPLHAEPGDVLVLTKPLGTNIAVSLFQWLLELDKWARVADVVDADTALAAYAAASRSMVRLNRGAARLMHEFGAHASTDVTGFGILGHAANLASNQLRAVSFVVHTLVTWRGMDAANTKWAPFRLRQGTAPETSGGLLVALPRDRAAAFCAALEQLDGQPAWIVGDVVEGERTARLAEQLTVLEV